MRVVLDTNVLVSGLINPFGSPGRVLDLVLRGDLMVLFDDRILGEYREVLSRSRFDFDPRDVRALLELLEAEGDGVVSDPLPVSLPDPGDLPFLEVAVSGRAVALVTGNRKHFPPTGRVRGLKIQSPPQFLRSFRQTTSTP